MKVIDNLCIVLAFVSGLILLAIIGLTFCDVILRYLFSAPIFGARDVLDLTVRKGALLEKRRREGGRTGASALAAERAGHSRALARPALPMALSGRHAVGG